MSAQELLDAICDDDRSAVKRLLKRDPSLVKWQFSEAKLYRHKIFHWMYVGDTALHLSAAGSRVEIVQCLLKAGADPNSRFNHRASGPLHYAADSFLGCPGRSAEKQVETIRMLLEAGAEINAQDKNGATPLHRAVRTRGAEAVKYLLKAGADPLLKNKPGSTAFHLAVQNTGRGGSGTASAKAAQREIIETFLSFGVDPGVLDARGKSVLDWAVSAPIRDLFRR